MPRAQAGGSSSGKAMDLHEDRKRENADFIPRGGVLPHERPSEQIRRDPWIMQS